MTIPLRPVLFICLALIAGAPQAETIGGPAVRALLFYQPDSSQGRDLFAFYLPGLFGRYGSRLEVCGVDTSTPAGTGLYRTAATTRGLPPLDSGTPAVLVGGQTLVGLQAIAEGLGDRFEDLASDPRSAQWPELRGLGPLLQQGIEAVAARVAKEGVVVTEPGSGSGKGPAPAIGDTIANALAVVVLATMALALLSGLARTRRGSQLPGTGRAAVLGSILLVGLGISVYMGYTSLADTGLVCGPIGSCADVQGSRYAKLFGIPMGVLGVAGYLAIFVTWLVARRRSPQGGGWHWLPWAIALAGLLFSMRLTFLEPFVIGKTCSWCLGSAISMTLTFWLLCGYAAAGRDAATLGRRARG